MGKRKVYLEKYEKAISHLKCNSDIDELYFNELNICMNEIKKIKGAKGTESYFNHIDFILKNTFGVEVAEVQKLING